MGEHILVISQYFYPENFRINDICTEWVKRGYKVTVLTGIPNYPRGRYFDGYGLLRKRKETYHGVSIIRIPLIPRGNNSIMLVLNYISFVLSGLFWQLFTKISADYVFIFEVSPMTQALPGVWYSRRKGIPCFLYVTDLWPENVEVVAGIRNKHILGLIGAMVDYIYERCDKIFTSSKSFIDAIAMRGVPRDKLEFWPQYAEDHYTPIDRAVAQAPEVPRDDMFNIVFAGNIGFAQGLDILPKVASMLRSQGEQVRFNIVGDGRFKGNLITMVKQYDVADMFNFIDKQPHHRIPHFMAVCDAALICLSKSRVFSMTLPAKTQSCLACGIPMLVSADGEIQSVVEESDAGLCSSAGDVEGLVRNIRRLMSMSYSELNEMRENARKYYKARFDKVLLLDQVDKYFQKGRLDRGVRE